MDKNSAKKFDPWNTYYETAEELELIKKRAAMKAANKAEYQKIITNPFMFPVRKNHDPNFQRFYSSRVTRHLSVYPTPANLTKFLFYNLIPIGCVIYFYVSNRKFRGECETGVYPYEKRALGYFFDR